MAIVLVGFILFMTRDKTTGDEDVSAPEIVSLVTPADKFVTLDGFKLRYRDEGTQGKPTMVLLHGFSYSLESWDALVTELGDDYHIIRFDFPAHGLSGPDGQGRSRSGPDRL